MYYLIEYSSSYSERTGSLWFCSKDEATNFDADIANNNIPKLLGNTVADGANGIIRNETIAVSLKYLTKFWRSLKKSLINCKIELKIKCIGFYLQLVLIMIMLIPIILFLLSTTQNDIFPL